MDALVILCVGCGAVLHRIEGTGIYEQTAKTVGQCCKDRLGVARAYVPPEE